MRLQPFLIRQTTITAKLNQLMPIVGNLNISAAKYNCQYILKINSIIFPTSFIIYIF